MPYLDDCHVSDRYNPVAWMDCGNALDHREVKDWGADMYTLTHHGLKTNGDLDPAVEAMSLFADENWNMMMQMIDDQYGARYVLRLFAVTRTVGALYLGTLLLN